MCLFRSKINGVADFFIVFHLFFIRFKRRRSEVDNIGNIFAMQMKYNAALVTYFGSIVGENYS